jgi:hypothetical protein
MLRIFSSLFFAAGLAESAFAVRTSQCPEKIFIHFEVLRADHSLQLPCEDCFWDGQVADEIIIEGTQFAETYTEMSVHFINAVLTEIRPGVCRYEDGDYQLRLEGPHSSPRLEVRNGITDFVSTIFLESYSPKAVSSKQEEQVMKYAWQEEQWGDYTGKTLHLRAGRFAIDEMLTE